MRVADDGRRRSVRELAELRSTQTIDGVRVRARCFSLTSARVPRYEIVVDGAGQHAIVDVRRREELQRRVRQAMDAFATAVRIRPTSHL